MVLVELLVITTTTVAVFVTALSYLILARVILQLFASDESPVFEFCYAVTEPVVSTVRSALSRVGSLADSPLDLSYVATFILLTIMRLMLPSITELF
ncbi:MAG: hypothetical protein CVU97_00215 [Firmicutes bacterium HGW-Firmicutes-21]|nr:MAG: hypothetical protein CVU97_00215 [Firmicutes bacterium HGW-Firmicutes-21]